MSTMKLVVAVIFIMGGLGMFFLSLNGQEFSKELRAFTVLFSVVIVADGFDRYATYQAARRKTLASSRDDA